jgi:predicted RNase H-like HicB family nuclease
MKFIFQHVQGTTMKLPKLTVVIEKEGEWYVATCPELNVASQGRTFDEAEAMIREAVELLLEEADKAEIKRRLNRGVKVKELELAHA